MPALHQTQSHQRKLDSLGGRGTSPGEGGIGAASPLQKLTASIPVNNVFMTQVDALKAVLTSSQLERLATWIPKDAAAVDVVIRHGVAGVIALHDADLNVRVATTLLTVTGAYSAENLKQREITALSFAPMMEDLQRMLSPESWQKIRFLRQSDPLDHKAPILALLRALQGLLRHRSVNNGKQEERGEPKVRTPQFYGSDCHYSTGLIVQGIRSLGIPASHRKNGEFGNPQKIHAFPWFPTLNRGFIHGDDLYHNPIIDPERRLHPEEIIRKYWMLSNKDVNEATDFRNSLETIQVVGGIPKSE